MYNRFMLIKDARTYDLEKYLDSKYTIVITWAEYCGPCTMTKMQLTELEAARNDLNVVELNVEDNQEFVIQKQIVGTPTVFIYKEGKEFDKFVGFLPKEEIERKLI